MGRVIPFKRKAVPEVATPEVMDAEMAERMARIDASIRKIQDLMLQLQNIKGEDDGSST